MGRRCQGKNHFSQGKNHFSKLLGPFSKQLGQCSHAFQQRPDYREVSRDPGQAKSFFVIKQGYPAQLVVILKSTRCAFSEFRQPDTHSRALIEGPPRGLTRLQLRPQPDRNSQLLRELPMKGSFGRLALLYFAAGKFPHSGELRGCSAAGYKESGRGVQGVDDGGAHHVYQSSH